MTTVVVAGGGIAGLTAALELEGLGADVVLLEAGDRLGGNVETLAVNGASVETGPDWFLTRSPEAVDLCVRLGLGDDLVAPSVTGARIYSRGRLRPLPAGFVRGFPSSLGALLRCDLLSPAGRVRAAADLVARSPLRGPDVSIGQFARSRFGDELLERVVDPLLAASRSGSPDEVSLAAGAPEVDAAARSGRGVIRGLRAAGAGGGVAGPFLGLRGGMARLTDALASALARTDVRLRTPARSARTSARGFEVEAGSDVVAAAGMVVAVPSFSAATLLRTLDGSVADELARIEYADAVVMALLYPAGAADPPPGTSGAVVPRSEGKLLTAFAWFSAKWPHARPSGGGMVMRCFAGRGPEDPAAALDDDELITRAADELGEMAGVRGRPLAATVTRRRGGLPVYRVGHLDAVARIEAALPAGVALAGAGYRGSGLPDCIRQGGAAARRIMEALESKERQT